jgi:hypothetical protein
MKKYLVIILMFSLVIGFTFANSTKTNATEDELALENKYLPMAREIIKDTVGDIEPYGSFYISRTDGMKFVFAFSTEDSKTDSLREEINSKLPSDLVVYRTDYKFSYSELLHVNDELAANWKKFNSDGTQIVESAADDIKDKVVITATKMTDATRDSLIKQFGSEILEIVINPDAQGITPQ